MNETIQTMLNRRSIRSFEEKIIPRKELEAMVEAGKNAPTGMNRQPYYIIVVQDEAALKKVGDIARFDIRRHPNPDFAKRADDPKFKPTMGAPCMIFVCGGTDEPFGFPVVDCALVAMNIMNAARSLGIGSCCLGAYGAVGRDPEGAKMFSDFGVPESFNVALGIAFGYPKDGEWPEARERKTDNVKYMI